ncbi:MAG: hypothetical protein M0008_03570 [Actinomycetota bacterium]|jgi:hypothetical protein|nr:hypothetical protein [Actinomycetota bacterium]
MTSSKHDPGTQELLDDILHTILAYVKQETIGKLSGLWKLAVARIVAAGCLALGSVLVVIAAIRALQTETGSALSGSLSWLPYVIGALIAMIGTAALSWTALRNPQPRSARLRSEPAGTNDSEIAEPASTNDSKPAGKDHKETIT